MGVLLTLIILLVVVATAKASLSIAAWLRSGGVPKW